GGPGGGGGGIGLSGDIFEPNNTSDHATQFGFLTTFPDAFTNLTVNQTPDGLPDYDWYRWTAGFTGTFTASITTVPSPGSGALELHVFTLVGHGPSVSPTLLELGNTVVGANATGALSFSAVA